MAGDDATPDYVVWLNEHAGSPGGLFPREEEREDARNEAAAAARSSGELLRTPLDRDEKQRILKGKMKAPVNYDDDDDARAAAARQPAGSGGDGKLMGDAIRAHGGTRVRFSISPPKPKKRKEDLATPFWYGMGRDGQSSTSTAGSDLDYSFYNIPVVSDALRNALAVAGLGHDAAPQRVYGRMLTACDRRIGQSRLQMPFKTKRWRAEHPIYKFLKPKEREAAEGEGLALKAYDRRGEEFELTCKHLRSNRIIRLTKNWSNFLRSNDLAVGNNKKKKAKGDGENEPAPAPAPATRDVLLDLWLFRGPEPKEEVGMVILHYRKGDAAHADAAFDEDDRTRTRTRLQDYDWGDAAMEDAAADANEEGQDDDDDAGANGEAPSSEPDGGGAKAGEERQAGGGPSEPLPLDADGTKTEEKEAGGAPAEAAVAEPASEAGVAAKAVGKEAGVAAKAVGKEAVAAPGEADGAKAEEKEASAPTGAAAEQPSDAGRAAKFVPRRRR